MANIFGHWYRDHGKRLLDVAAAVTLLPPVGIVLGVAATGILLEDGWPVLYISEREGRGSSTFRMLKLRSMRHGAIARRGPEGEFLTFQQDPRVTTLGAFLRRTSIDELPQVLNVLKGDMSLIGPRPHIPTGADTRSNGAATELRRLVRPGLTGLAQVSGRNALSNEEKSLLDDEYARDVSLWTDVKIALLTVRSVIGQRGVNNVDTSARRESQLS